MDPGSALTVNVHELLEHPGSRKHFSFDAPVEGLSNELVRVPTDPPLHFELMLEAIDEGGILVRGSISGEYVVSCRRCLDEVRRPFRVEVAEVYRQPGSGVWEEGFVVDQERLDLRPAVRDNVVLDMPLYPVCRDDCAGLCSRCGTNLNRGDCACPAEAPDERWSELKGLLGQ
jgi:uncharacterized protein